MATDVTYQENYQTAVTLLDSVSHATDPSRPEVALQLAQVHAQLAIAAAVRAVWRDCDCR